ncbi:hypothetical protein [Dyella sp.]|uniref:hypothetical protein n=1 Tax=Dyella sp. TaxID=1869338 RepID=UPI002D788796|nr:hypothetical protein [Dyella sp.]HET7331124.1 hypothetical protein [Dyella sp.]
MIGNTLVGQLMPREIASTLQPATFVTPTSRVSDGNLFRNRQAPETTGNGTTRGEMA